jgi:hypothetical protein
MPASTNFLQFNPNQTNQETDSIYAADSTRAGGAGTGSVFASALANKSFYQWSTFIAAFCQMLVNKGISTSDANFNQLVAGLAQVLTTADQKPGLLVVPFASTLVFDCSKANGFEIVLSGNVTSSTIINAAPGQIVTFIIVQNSVGGHAFVWPTSGIYGNAPIEQGAVVVNIQSFIVRSNGSLYPIGPITAN